MSGAILIERLEAGRVEPGTFGHREHLQAAYELLQREPFLDAAARYARAIDAFARSVGATDKFNLTVTLAFLSLVAERMSAERHASFAEFLAANPALAGNALEKYYTPLRLANPLSRRVFLMPDCQAAPNS